MHWTRQLDCLYMNFEVLKGKVGKDKLLLKLPHQA